MNIIKKEEKMETKNKIIKRMGVYHKITKGFYYASGVLCLVFIVLAIVLACTNAISSLAVAETACLFGTLALYAFVCMGLLWNIASLFKSVEQEQAPFSQKVSHYLKKSAIFVILLATVPALIGSLVLKIIYPATELVFPVSLGGVIAGIAILLVSIFFNYGKELQKNADETLW